jgi:hypothetical protein
MSPLSARIFFAASTSALVLALAPSAWSFERQWHAGVDAGYAGLTGDNGASGYGGGAHLAYGLSDAFNALLELDISRHPGDNTTIWSGGAGAAYTIDVARAVPYLGLLAGGYKLHGDLSSTGLGFQVVLGLDYQLERNWAIGVQARMHTIFAGDPVGVREYATTFLRAEYVWGF